MWVQTDHHIIDFMAPVYSESFAHAQPDMNIPRRMFQKLKAEDKEDLDGLAKVGDYIVFPDPDLSEHMIDHFLSRPANTDLLQISEVWFGTRRGKQKPTITMGSNDGFVRELTLPKTVAAGVW